ncbi:hypothetical protein L3X38_041943 [Prunus dulcis]|uniref:Uncharacterized protein n=1 Tax=Prunus dulcis TaxID=3755 RepID=A0AAD4UVC4_PRUDU|nr:hypothetical protein L3X38_041943 [Prunus dulcis]
MEPLVQGSDTSQPGDLTPQSEGPSSGAVVTPPPKVVDSAHSDVGLKGADRLGSEGERVWGLTCGGALGAVGMFAKNWQGQQDAAKRLASVLMVGQKYPRRITLCVIFWAVHDRHRSPRGPPGGLRVLFLGLYLLRLDLVLAKYAAGFSCLQIWHAQWNISASHLFLQFQNQSTHQKRWLPRRFNPFPRREAKAISASQHVTSIPTQAKAKDVHRRREPVINLTSLGQKKNTSRADERNSQSEGRSFSGSKNSRERSLSPDSSTGSYHGSPPDDQQKKLTSASVGESYSMAMQVMVTGAMSVEEQLAHMSKAVTKLTKMVEKKDAQIASLINKWEVHQDKEPGQDAHKKVPHHEAESSEKGLGHETESSQKSHEKVDVASVGSLSVQQLQDMIANTIRV